MPFERNARRNAPHRIVEGPAGSRVEEQRPSYVEVSVQVLAEVEASLIAARNAAHRAGHHSLGVVAPEKCLNPVCIRATVGINHIRRWRGVDVNPRTKEER